MYRCIKTNHTILCNTELLFGDKLPQGSSLPGHICAPCERRLNNSISVNKKSLRILNKLCLIIFAQNVVWKYRQLLNLAPAKVQAGTLHRQSIEFHDVVAVGTQSVSPVQVSRQ